MAKRKQEEAGPIQIPAGLLTELRAWTSGKTIVRLDTDVVIARLGELAGTIHGEAVELAKQRRVQELMRERMGGARPSDDSAEDRQAQVSRDLGRGPGRARK